MKLLSFLLLLLSFYTFALSECGDGFEKTITNLNWNKLTDISIDSSLIVVNGRICAGINPATNEYAKIIYRDSLGNSRINTIEEVKAGMVIFSYKDLDATAKKILKNADYITLKLLKTSKNQDNSPLYKISIKFLRKFAAISTTEFKTITIDSSYWPSRDNVYSYAHEAGMWFDNLEVGLGAVPPAITTINFESSWNGQSKKVWATALP